MYNDYYDWYEPTVAKEVKGGIKAQSRRGAFAVTWWGKRWIEALECLHIGGRLNRGRSYARKGQVATLHVLQGCVAAEVQGSGKKPYQVSIEFQTFSKPQWCNITEKILEKPVFAAQLLGKEMPQELEKIFQDAGLSLFPKGEKDMNTSCSCPDWSNPCKHIAAVFYLMAEAFDNDPFLIFVIRGMEKDTFMDDLHRSKSKNKRIPSIEPEPLSSDVNDFWEQSHDIKMISGFSPVKLHAALPKRLGLMPFWRSRRDFIGQMEEIYRLASNNSKQIFEEEFRDKK
jgi:uncharacterized Zn finger protein